MTLNTQITSEVTLPDVSDSIQCLTATFPVAPASPTLGTISDISVPAAPEFGATRPVLSSIPIPDVVQVTLPSGPELSVVEAPVAPDFVLPPVPTVSDFSLPTAPQIAIPTFDKVAPTLPDTPNTTFEWTNADLITQLSQDIETRLEEFVGNDSTGVVIEVQDEIWQRDRLREDALYTGLVDRVGHIAKSRGLKVPPVVLADFAKRALNERQHKSQTVERDVLIEIANLKQTNFKAAVENILKFEALRIDNHNKFQQRELDGRVAAVDLAVKLFNAEVALYEADAQIFGIKAEIFKVQLEAELAKLEVYRAELESLQVVSALNESLVKVYVGQLEGVKAQVEVFKAQIEAAEVLSEVNTSKVEVFRGNLEAFKTQVEADTTAQQIYASRVSAEGLRVDAYVAETKAFRAEGEAYESVVKAKVAELEADVNIKALFPAEILNAEVAAFVSVVEAEAAQIAATTAAIASQVQVESVRLDAVGDVAGLTAKAEIISADIDLLCSSIDAQAILAEARTFVASSNIQQANERQAGQIEGQLAAATISKDSISNNDSFSISTSTSTSDTKSTNTSHTSDSRSIESFTEAFTDTLIHTGL